MPGLINLDFADVTTIMSGMGLAIMGTSVGGGDNRAVEAARRAIASPLLEDASIEGARGVVINVTGGSDMSMIEVSEAISIIHDAAHEEANIIFGAVVDPSMEGQVKITVIATGFEEEAGAHRGRRPAETPVDLQSYESWRQPEPADLVAALTVERRPVLELPGPAGGEPTSSESMDVPVFLRNWAK